MKFNDAYTRGEVGPDGERFFGDVQEQMLSEI